MDINVAFSTLPGLPESNSVISVVSSAPGNHPSGHWSPWHQRWQDMSTRAAQRIRRGTPSPSIHRRRWAGAVLEPMTNVPPSIVQTTHGIHVFLLAFLEMIYLFQRQLSCTIHCAHEFKHVLREAMYHCLFFKCCIKSG